MNTTIDLPVVPHRIDGEEISGGAARRFQKDIRVGMIGINVPIPVPVATFSDLGFPEND